MPVHPEVGQMALVRDRHWVVSDVERAAPRPAATSILGQPGQTLVDLTSVEDDGFGEDLNVVWELEPGARVLEAATLPRPAPGHFDDPARLDAFLDAVRWGAIQSADARALQAPFRSGITIEDYQLDPVVRALQVPRVNLLIADDVGLGKTIEAGLVIQELLLRHRARTVMIVCPASLCLKWQAEMAEKFGLEFQIVDSEAVKNLRRARGVGANIWSSFPRLIVSVDWLKRPRAMSLLDERLAGAAPTRYPRAFDLLVIDEVHGCAPAGRGRYATDSQRTRAIRKIAPHFEHRLFLSATPHNGYSESFTALLELLDPQRFARGVQPSEENLKRAVVRRMKSELRKELAPRADGSPRFAERKIVPLEVEYPDAERQVHRWLAEYAESRRQGAKSGTSRTASEFVSILLKKRLFSSPAAFLNTIDQHLVTLGRRQRALEADDALLRAAFERLDEEIGDEEDLAEATEDALATAARTMEPLSADQHRLLSQMREWAAREAGRPDAKAKVLLAWLEQTCRPGGQWNDERVIVFTEYRDTQNWLLDLLTAAGLAGDRVALLYGGMDTEEREHTKAVFQADPSRSPVRILLATDAASEGIDLQKHCHRMVHVEIPFSPSRLEQRNGRIDRHGQPSPEVLIHHFVGKGYQNAAPGSIEADLDFLSRVARKVETIRDELGSAGPVLATQVEEAMLGRRTVIDDAAIELGRRLSSLTVLDLRDAEEKRALYQKLTTELGHLEALADLLVGVTLSTAGRGERAAEDERRRVMTEFVEPAYLKTQTAADFQARVEDIRNEAAYLLDTGRPPKAPERRCLHWPLTFPEVFLDPGRTSGFDAMVGNPPFLGGKRISGPMGLEFCEYLVEQIADGRKGNADLVAYFYLRGAALGRGIGMLATNTIAQGDTREVGLDWLLGTAEWLAHRAVKSRPWPGGATLEVAQLWLRQGAWAGRRVLDGESVAAITPSLDARGRSTGNPFRLRQNLAHSFIGSALNTDQFILDASEAIELLRDPRNADVLHPFLNGEDLNTHPAQAASRYSINFLTWPKWRAEQYPACFALADKRVRPEVEAKERSYDGWLGRWWQFWRVREELYEAIGSLERTLAIALTSKVVMPVFVSPRQVFSHATAVFAYDDDFHFGVLTSAFHWWWAVTRASTLETRIRYTPSDCFETFAQPPYAAAVEEAGKALDEHRRPLMITNNEGLTKTYNRVHNPADTSPGIVRLRELHVALDHAVRDAYGWRDLDLDHGFHETSQGVRYTIGPAARTEVLDRLLELNHQRYAEEVAAGLHERRRGAGKRRSRQKVSQQADMFSAASHTGGKEAGGA